MGVGSAEEMKRAAGVNAGEAFGVEDRAVGRDDGVGGFEIGVVDGLGPGA